MINIMTLEVLIEQLSEGDATVYDVVQEILKADMSKEETKRVNELFTKIYNKIPLMDISDIQISLALYALERPEDIQKFYKWVNDRLELWKQGKSTKVKFYEQWNKAYNKILDKLNDDNVAFYDKAAINNIIFFINDLKSKEV